MTWSGPIGALRKRVVDKHLAGRSVFASLPEMEETHRVRNVCLRPPFGRKGMVGHFAHCNLRAQETWRNRLQHIRSCPSTCDKKLAGWIASVLPVAVNQFRGERVIGHVCHAAIGWTQRWYLVEALRRRPNLPVIFSRSPLQRPKLGVLLA